MAESVETIAKLKKKLKKAKDSAGTALDILGVLQRATITRGILEQTGIGKTVAKLSSKSKDPGVKSAAEALLKTWRSIATKEKQAKKGGSAGESSLPTDDLRKRVCTMLQKEFSNPSVSEKAKLSVCVGIEKAMFVKFNKNTQSKEYKGKFRSLKFNLGKNADLRTTLINGKVSPEELVSMKASEVSVF